MSFDGGNVNYFGTGEVGNVSPEVYIQVRMRYVGGQSVYGPFVCGQDVPFL